MEATICPWCQTEIVWDEDIGPEEICPYCNNELKGYRTLNISLGSEDEFDDEQEDHDQRDHTHNHSHNHKHSDHDHDRNDDDNILGYWDDGENINYEGASHIPGVRSVEHFTATGGDPLVFEAGIARILDQQAEVPECPHCREYMLFTGKQSLGQGEFSPIISKGLSKPLIKPSAKLNVYVCSACFYVSRFLAEEDRVSFIQTVSEAEEN